MFWQFLILSILHHSVQSLKQYIHVKTAKTWKDAEQYCLNTYNSHLLTLNHDSELREFLSQCNTDGSYCNGWIGLNDQSAEGSFEWVDGSECAHSGKSCVRHGWNPRAFRMTLNYRLYRDCVYVRRYYSRGAFYMDYCHRRQTKKSFYCNPKDIAEDDPLDDDNSKDKYIVGKSLRSDRPVLLTWARAQSYCEKYYRSSLATITNKEELEAAKRIAKYGSQNQRTRPIYNFWIGLNDLSDDELLESGQGDESENVEDNEENVFTWIDGQTECDYNAEKNCGLGDLWCTDEGAVVEEEVDCDCALDDEVVEIENEDDCVYLRTGHYESGTNCFDATVCDRRRYFLCNAFGSDYDGDAGGVLPFGDFGENYWLPNDPEEIPDDAIKPPAYDNKWNFNVDLTSLLFGIFITLLIGNIIYWMNYNAKKKKPHQYKSVSVDSSDTDA